LKVPSLSPVVRDPSWNDSTHAEPGVVVSGDDDQ
jgi:hypothetical protein